MKNLLIWRGYFKFTENLWRMKKLFGNRFALISYFGIIVTFFTASILQVSTITDSLTFIIPFSVLFFFIWTIYYGFIKRNQNLIEKLKTIGIIVIPIILVYHFIFFTEAEKGIYLSVMLMMFLTILMFAAIPVGLLNKNFMMGLVFLALLSGMVFKSVRIPGANEVSILVAPILLFNIFVELFLIRKIKEGKKEYTRLFFLQSLAFIALTASFWIFFAGLYDLIIGKLLVYIYFIVNLFTFILLPKTNYFNWHPILKNRFIQNSVYIGLFFLAIAFYFALSDTLGYEILTFETSDIFPDYPIDFNTTYIQ